MVVIHNWGKLKKSWKLGNKRASNFLYIGDTVQVVKGRKVAKDTVGKIIKLYENAYDPIRYDHVNSAFALQGVGYKIEAIQYTNARCILELENKDTVWTYLNNLELIKESKE